jgi:hypothetical protein
MKMDNNKHPLFNSKLIDDLPLTFRFNTIKLFTEKDKKVNPIRFIRSDFYQSEFTISKLPTKPISKIFKFNDI